LNEYNIGSLSFWKIFFEELPAKLKLPYRHISVRMYDCLANHLSNGGLTYQRIDDNKVLEIDKAQEAIIQLLHSVGINFDQLLTNFYFKKELFDDRLIKRLTILNEQGGQGVTVSTFEIANYIHLHFPNLLIRWSITASYRDQPKSIVDYVNKVLESPINRIVIPVEYNNLLDTLSRMPTEKLELMAYDRCGICRFRKMHYTLSSADQVRLVNDKLYELNLNKDFCSKIHAKNEKICQNPTLLMPEDLDKLIELGITKFKLASRNFVELPDTAFYLDLVNRCMVGDSIFFKGEIQVAELEKLRRDMRALKKEVPN